MKTISFSIVLMLVFFQTTITFAGEKEEIMGKQLFMRFCAQCHGKKGDGKGINAESEAMDPAPHDLCDLERPYMKQKDNAYLIRAIKFGDKREPKTSPLMPHWYMTLSDYDITSIAAFVRTLHKHGQPPIVFSRVSKKRPKISVSQITISNPSKAGIKAGKKVYKNTGCIGCHAIMGFGGISGPDLAGVGSRLDAQQIWRIIKYPSSIKPSTRMPAYDISDKDGALLVGYLATLREE